MSEAKIKSFEGHAEVCTCCLKPIDSLAGNPGKWGTQAYDKWYHWECIHKAVDYYLKYTYGTSLSPRDDEQEWAKPRWPLGLEKK